MGRGDNAVFFASSIALFCSTKICCADHGADYELMDKVPSVDAIGDPDAPLLENPEPI